MRYQQRFHVRKEDLVHVKTELVFKMINQKKAMSAWIWILIILILVAVGVGVYFLLSGNGTSIISGGNSIPQPPALPTG